MGYEYIEHPSDIIVLAKGESFEEAFIQAAQCMFDNMGGRDARESGSFELEYSAPNQEQLVVQLLTEVIAECETIPFTPIRMEVISFQSPVAGKQDTDHPAPDTASSFQSPVSGSRYKIAVRVFGEKKVPENIVKAVTYNSLRIEEKEGEWEIQVLFDI